MADTEAPPLDATARAALRAKAEAARDTMAYAACRVLDGEMDHEANAIASRAQGEFLHAVSSPDVILALLAAVERGEADTRRLRTLAEQVAGGPLMDETFASVCAKLDSDAARANPPIQETDDEN